MELLNILLTIDEQCLTDVLFEKVGFKLFRDADTVKSGAGKAHGSLWVNLLHAESSQDRKVIDDWKSSALKRTPPKKTFSSPAKKPPVNSVSPKISGIL